ncbi:MAG: polysaccharide biosynthesis/export family protein [Nitrospiraceae bacterium]
MIGRIWSMLAGGVMTLAVVGIAFAAEGGSTQSRGGGSKCVGSSCGAAALNADAQGEQGEEPYSLVAPDYMIGPEDVLEITVWQDQDLSKIVTVRPDGKISLPLINDVMAAGKTPARLTKELSVRLREYVENPSVSIVVKDVNSYNVFVLGEVRDRASIPSRSKRICCKASRWRGGFTNTAARDRLTIYRFGKNREELKLNYDDIVVRDDNEKQNIELAPGDVVLVPSQKTVLR